jgi:hypothetical protein
MPFITALRAVGYLQAASSDFPTSPAEAQQTCAEILPLISQILD